MGATPDSIEGTACGVYERVRGVWFRFVAGPNSSNQLTTVSVDESSFYSGLILFSGTCSSLMCMYPEVDPSDEVFGDGGNAVSFVAVPGQTYFILLAGWYFFTDFGTYNISISVS